MDLSSLPNYPLASAQTQPAPNEQSTARWGILFLQLTIIVGVWVGIFLLNSYSRNIVEGSARDKAKRKQAEENAKTVAALRGKWKSTHSGGTILHIHDHKYSLKGDKPILEGPSYHVQDGLLHLRYYVTGGEITRWQLHFQVSSQELILWGDDNDRNDQHFLFLVLRRDTRPDEPKPFKLRFMRIDE